MLGAFKRWRDGRSGRRAVTEMVRMQARESATFSFLILEKLDEARQSMQGGDHARAAKLWQEALASDPLVAKGAPNTVHLLLGLGRFEEAEAIMAEGMSRFPADPIFAEGHAYVAQRRGERAEAVRRWEAVRAKFPRYAAGFYCGAIALRDDGRLDEAESLLTKAIADLPPDLVTHMEHARVAAQREDWPVALERWSVVERFGHFAAFAGQAQALRGLRRFAEAERLVAEKRLSFPLEHDLAFEYARIAEDRDDWPEAARRWDGVWRKFPMVHHPYERAVQAHLRANDDAGAATALAEALERFPEDRWFGATQAEVAARAGARGPGPEQAEPR